MIFQLTRSRGAWPWKLLRLITGKVFQLTRSRGAWRSLLFQEETGLEFQLTRSRGAWLSGLWLNIEHLDFNSHAHVERDEFQEKITDESKISTHTLTWSVTQAFHSGLFALQFQLTRSRGAWPVSSSSVLFISNFNSHAHVERDLEKNIQCNHLQISTHTLTWSVTLCCIYSSRRKKFQLTRSRGAWQWGVWITAWARHISTHTLTWSVTNFPI